MGFINNLKYILFPNRCVHCNCAVSKGHILCDECLEIWEKEKQKPCTHCGRPHIRCSCLLKLDEDVKIPVVYHLAEYKRDSVAADIIIALKRRENSDICKFLAEEFLENICDGEDFSDAVVTFVPRRREVVRETGSDQAMEISKAVCCLSGKEVFCAFKRKGRTDQKKLGVDERKKNALRSYELNKGVEGEIEGNSFFIFDDVITSGSTVLACAELLLEKGASKVTAVSVGRRT